MSIEKIRASRRSGRLAVFVSLASALLVAAGCGGSHTPGNSTPNLTDTSQPGWAAQTTTYQQTTKPWTVLVYMDGANNLDTYALANLNQMETVGSTANLNMVVQFKRGSGFDANADYTYDSSEGGWSGTRRYYVTKDSDTFNINSTLISTNQSLDMGNYQSLQAFIQWGIAAFPAQHYALIIWDHGSGWRSEAIGPVTKTSTGTRAASATTNLAKTRGIAFDDVSSDYILTSQLPAAIDMGNGRKWDLVVYDASLMQMAEVDYQIKDKTNLILGSEESPPGGGYPYDTIMGDLNANPTWSGQNWGTDIAQKTFAFYQTNPFVGGVRFDSTEITQSLIDTSKLTTVASAFNSLGSALSAAQTTSAAQIATARSGTEHYALDEQSSDPSTFAIYGAYKDAMDFTNQLTADVTDSGVLSASATARAALQSAILYSVHGTLHPRSLGLSMYIPTPTAYATDDQTQASGQLWEGGTSNDRYGSLAFPLAAPNWQTFLATAKQ